MALPTYDEIMLPLLRLASDGTPRSLSECIEEMSRHFGLTDEERQRRLPSGGETYIRNRVGWARTYLKKAGLVSYPKRAFMGITDRGKEVLAQNPKHIDKAFLSQFQEFVEFQSRAPKGEDEARTVLPDDNESQTPQEALESNYQKLRSQLADELLEQVKNCSPEFFERLVVQLLVSMGYGGTLEDAGQATQRSNDGGIDGIIKEDRLGLDTIYIQAKKWENTVHRPEIQKFAGALQEKRARKGVFITTSGFSPGAWETTKVIDNRIVLIDGEKLANYMIDFNVGCSPLERYEIKKLDSDYFSDE